MELTSDIINDHQQHVTRHDSGRDGTVGPSPPSMVGIVILFLCPMIFVAAGTSTAFFGIRGIIRAKSTVAWPTTQGKVQSSVIQPYYNDDCPYQYQAKITYDFSVNNTTFSGSRITFGSEGYRSCNVSVAQQIVNRYPKYKIVTVYYMPKNPEVCLLEPGNVNGKEWLLSLLVFGLIFFTAGSCCVFFSFRLLIQTRDDQMLRRELWVTSDIINDHQSPVMTAADGTVGPSNSNNT
jgi:hypothetical protein